MHEHHSPVGGPTNLLPIGAENQGADTRRLLDTGSARRSIRVSWRPFCDRLLPRLALDNWITFCSSRVGETPGLADGLRGFEKMLDVSFVPNIGAVAVLVIVSFVSFVAGFVFRKWPDKVQAFTEEVDGFALFVTPEAHRAMIVQCGFVLVAVSFAALLAAAWII
jgi:hypothetical protein